ncbi:MAG: NUDIX domain-containing protein [Thaumarchaeota archaeon]|nr:NUDIX domain-containing protein [Nitrososphaerota archaeon]
MSNIQKTARLTPLLQGQQPEEVAHISSFAMIRKGNGLLLAKKIRPEFSAGKWVFPSSIINFGEHPEVAIMRIVREWVGVDSKKVRLLDVQSYGDKHWDLCFVYEVSIDEIGKLSQDIERAEYFDRGKLPPEFRSDNLEVLQNLENKMKV